MNRAELNAVAHRAFLAEGIDTGRLAGKVGDSLLDSYQAIVQQTLSAIDARPARLTVLGLCGAQGSGKSTTARVVQDALHELSGLSVATLSLDDLYLSRSTRAHLAETIHPLFATRGVPGTHDITRGLSVIAALERADATTLTALPRFDKATDEPVEASAEPRFAGRPDVLIFEGWCPYQALFARVDRLVMLRAPHFECVSAWRQEQEHKLARRLRVTGGAGHPSRVMNAAEVTRFVMYFERVTRHVLAEMPDYADLVIELDNSREVRSIDTKR